MRLATIQDQGETLLSEVASDAYEADTTYYDSFENPAFNFVAMLLFPDD